MRRTKRIILAGPSASGKDYLADCFVDRGFIKNVSLTTRNPRDLERAGSHYYYTDDKTFDTHNKSGDFYSTEIYNKWKYGILNKSWTKADLFIMTPDSISKINPQDREDCIVVYIQIPENIRRSRIMLRNGVDDTNRRINADREMFKGFIDYDYRIKIPNFNPDTWISLLGKASNILL